MFNRTVEGVEARIGLPLCFGNYIGRPVAHRTYAPLFPHILDAQANEIAMEFANPIADSARPPAGPPATSSRRWSKGRRSSAANWKGS